MTQYRPIQYLPWLCLLAYVAAALYTSYHHEMFLDETDIWSFARDATWAQARVYFAQSGHPPLWHTVLFPFARLGYPAEAMQFINVLFAGVTAYLILFRGRFPWWLKVSILCSFAFGYQYAVVARGYMLMLMIMSIIAILYPARRKHPIGYFALLGLLCNTETYAIIMACALALQFGLELMFERGMNRHSIAAFFRNKRYLLGSALCFSLCLLCLIALLPNEQTRYRMHEVQIKQHRVERSISKGFFPQLPAEQIQTYVGLTKPEFRQLSAGLGLMVMLGVLVALASWKLRLIYTASMLWPMVLFSSIYSGSLWHYMLYPMVSLMFLWADGAVVKNGWHRKASLVVMLMLSLSLFASAPGMLQNHRRDIASVYSPGKTVATRLKTMGLAGEPLILFLCHWNSSITAYMPNTTFWEDRVHGISTFALWSKKSARCYRNPKYKKKLDIAMREMGVDTIYAVSLYRMSSVRGYHLKRLFQSKGKMNNRKTFYVYEITKI